jgi:hypothetical protein
MVAGRKYAQVLTFLATVASFGNVVVPYLDRTRLQAVYVNGRLLIELCTGF